MAYNDWFKIGINIYRTDVLVLVTKSPSFLRKIAKRCYGDKLKSYDWCGELNAGGYDAKTFNPEYKNGGNAIVIVFEKSILDLPEHKRQDTISHECYHAAMIISQGYGYIPSYSGFNEEPFAYLLGYLVRETTYGLLNNPKKHE